MRVLKIAEPGQAAFTTVGETTWNVPTGIDEISIVCVGGGGAGGNTGAGSGGTLSYATVAVSGGDLLTIYVGSGGTYEATSGNSDAEDSSVKNGGSTLCLASKGRHNTVSAGLSTGDDYYLGGIATANGGSTWGTGGGGAGGYSGAGGNGGDAIGVSVAGTGGAGGGGAESSTVSGQGGGGVGILGEGANGTASGGGGSGGTAGTTVGGPGGDYGGGGGGRRATGGGANGAGGDGAVRIIWGTGRSYPSTDTGDV